MIETNAAGRGSSEAARFLIIDDHPLFREALIAAVNIAYPDAVTDECESLTGAMSRLHDDDGYDLALLDLKIPDTVGLEGLLDIRARHPRLPIVVVSGHEDPRIIKSVLSYGAAGFISKSTNKRELTEAIQSVMNGEIYVPASYEEPAGSDAEDARRGEMLKSLSTLTPQQFRVIRMLRDGLLNKQIAYELQVGETTVKAHVSEILRKLNVNNRTQAAMELSRLSGHEIEELNSKFDVAG
ncbi:MAG: response regulator transcription factor [Nitratireductor sp.]|nr:response regulator transcription factor [Nitratireductor sp.]MCC0020194.1 response regulator transcription factor [Nitratireductor sp.]